MIVTLLKSIRVFFFFPFLRRACSGSTGKPKGVLHTTAGYLIYAATTFKYVFDYHPGDIYWCTADIGWITGHTYVVYGPLANGATSVVVRTCHIFFPRMALNECPIRPDLIERLSFSLALAFSFPLQLTTSCLFDRQFEGTPFYPDNDRYWSIVDKYKVTQFYTAPTAIRSLMKFGDDLVKRHSLSSLKVSYIVLFVILDIVAYSHVNTRKYRFRSSAR